MRGDILFVVDGPNLVFSFVRDALVFRFLNLDFELVEFVAKPGGGACRFIIAAANVLLLEIPDVFIDDAGGELRIRGLKADVHELAIGYALHAEAAEKGSEFGRALLIFQAASGQSLRRTRGRGELRPGTETAAADGLQGQSFTRQNFRLRLDVVIEIHHVPVRIHALKRKNAGIFAVDFDAGGGHIDGLHAESSDGDDGNDGKQK